MDGGARKQYGSESSNPKDAFDPQKVWNTTKTSLPTFIDMCWGKTKKKRIVRVGFRIKGVAFAPKDFEIYRFTTSGKPVDMLTIRNAQWKQNDEFQSWIIPKEKRSFNNCYGLRLRESMGDVDAVILSNIQMWEQA